MRDVAGGQVDLARTIQAYDNWIVKAYCWGRFKILRQPFLDEIGQYLPRAGNVLDIGCGFGLFSLYYAQRFPALNILGVDVSASRVEVARQTASRLSVSNVRYEIADAAALTIAGELDGVYMLDVVHHVAPAAVRPLLREIYAKLKPRGRLILKDVDTEPGYKRRFTLVLDKLLGPRSPVHYWPRVQLLRVLSETGFEVFYHSMPDLLPYPHVLYVCSKPGEPR